MTPHEQYYSTDLGSLVGTPLNGFWQHVGILVPDDQFGFRRSVISRTQKGLIRQPVEEFAGGKYFSSVDYPGDLPWWMVVERAELAVVNRPYHATDSNCDHFVRYCHGVKEESPQAAATVVLALFAVLGGLALAAAK